jgi:hypothetical protein
MERVIDSSRDEMFLAAGFIVLSQPASRRALAI